jgi:hypothetical protein
MLSFNQGPKFGEDCTVAFHYVEWKLAPVSVKNVVETDALRVTIAFEGYV